MNMHAVTPDPALSIERLAVNFGARCGLDDVTLDVAIGERLVVIGPSGAGKTTLLRVIAGLEPARAGRVRVRGRDVTSLAPDRRDVVYLHQTPVLFDHLSVGENIAFPLRVRRQRGAGVDARVHEVLAAMRLEGFERRMPHALSGGQRHRVALGRAIAARPAALLLDEPLSALDPALRDEVRTAIVAAQAEYGPAMVIVTHDLDDVALLADRTAVLLDGGVAQVATPERLFHRPASLGVVRLLGLHQELTGVADSNGTVTCALGRLPIDRDAAAYAAGAVVVAIRAESVRLGPPASGAIRGCVIATRLRARGPSVVVRLEGLLPAVNVEAAVRHGAPSWRNGDAVSVSLDPAGVLVYPASSVSCST